MVSNASGEHGDTGDRNGEIARVLEDVLVRRSHGEEVDAKSVCASHPSLMPELEEQLAALEVVEAAAQRAASGDDEGKEQSGDQADSAHLEDAPGSDWDEHSSSDAYAASNSSAYPRMPGYRITGVLGHGGMGVVYRAVQTKLNRVVALKVLPAIVGIASPSAVARFRREAAAAARLHHTNIVPVHDFGESDDGYYYAMELVHGRPMDEVIRYFREKHILTPDAEQLEHALEATSKSDAYASDDGLSKVYRSELDLCAAQAAFSITTPKPDSYYRQVARWVADAADALHYAHGQRIIHRDVKPSNLLLSVDGRVMVADFGLAKNTDEKTMTRTGVMLGTVMYLSPEQAQSDKMRVDHRSDIYSLGATLFELICHRPVFLGNDEKQVLAAIINQEPVRPRRVVSAIPSELETICLKCLEKSPDARYETAEDMAADLRRFIGDLPIVAKRPSLFTRGVKYVRRHKAAVIALTAVLLLVAASFGIAYISRERELADINSLLQEGVRYSNDGKDAAANQKFAIARNSFAEAAKLFEEILQDHPNHFKALGNLAIAKKELFNAQSEPDTSLLEEADGYLLRALAVNPEHAGLLNIHGVVLKMLGRYEEAAGRYREVVDQEPKHVEGRNNLAIAEALSGNLESALTSLGAATELTGREDPCDAVTWRTLGSIVSITDSGAALAHFAQAIFCEPGDFWAQVGRARCYLMSDDPKAVEAALYDADSAVRNARTPDPVFLRVRGHASLRNARYEDALKYANEALSDGDLACPNLLVKAGAYIGLDRLDEAREAYRAAMDSWPAHLKDKDSVEARAPKGVLWFEGEIWLSRLQAQVKASFGNDYRE